MTSLTRRLRAWNRDRVLRNRDRAAVRNGEGRSYALWVERYDTIDEACRERFPTRARNLHQRPLISLLMPVHDPDPRWLAEAIDSIRAQHYEHWELCIADDCSADPRIHNVLRYFESLDSRIRLQWRETNGHISAASNTALAMARGEFIALIDHDDRIPEHALLVIAETLQRHPQAAVLYSDEDKIDDAGRRCDPYFKPDFDRELLRGYNVVSHFGVYRTSLLRSVGGFRSGFEGSQDHDLALRCIDAVTPDRVIHIPHVLYHWRIHANSTAGGLNVKPYALVAGRRALEEHLARCGIEGEVEPDPAGFYQTDYRMIAPPSVAIVVIDSGDDVDLARALHSVMTTLPPHDGDIVVASRRKRAPAIASFHGVRWCGSPKESLPTVVNRAVADATQELLALVDSRCVMRDPEWLRKLASHAKQRDVGAAGAKLVQRKRIVGSGLVLGGDAGYVALDAGGRSESYGYGGRSRVAQQVSALDHGCLVLRRSVFADASGFDPSYCDLSAVTVDLMLRIAGQGLRHHYVPSVQVQSTWRWPNLKAMRRHAADRKRLIAAWKLDSWVDRAWNPNLGLRCTRARHAFPPRVCIDRPWFETKPESPKLSETLPPMPLPVHRATTGSCSGI